jgi:prephenate dehydrogenase
VASQVRSLRLALLGVGYIGGSAALAARRAGIVGQVVGYDPLLAATQAAVQLGVVDEAASSPQAAVRGASMVLLAAPVRSLETLLGAIAPALEADTTVIDVGSVKAGVVACAEAARMGGRFVGCHPMAGAEYSGVEAANAEIFPGRVCFICPGQNTQASAVAAAHEFWRSLGCQTVSLDAEIHDRLMAAQSHLPHVAAFALAAALLPSLPFLETTTTAASPTTSLRDTTRIAASGSAVWRDILLANQAYVLPMIEELETRVAEIRRAVEAGDGEALERILAAAQFCRKRLVKE